MRTNTFNFSVHTSVNNTVQVQFVTYSYNLISTSININGFVI